MRHSRLVNIRLWACNPDRRKFIIHRRGQNYVQIPETQRLSELKARRDRRCVATISDLSYTKCAGLLQRSVALYLSRIPLNGAIFGKRNLCRTRRMTRHVTTVSYTMADLFAVHEGSPCVRSLGERATNKVDLPTNRAPKFDEMCFSLFPSIYISFSHIRACVTEEFNFTP